MGLGKTLEVVGCILANMRGSEEGCPEGDQGRVGDGLEGSKGSKGSRSSRRGQRTNRVQAVPPRTGKSGECSLGPGWKPQLRASMRTV